MGEHHIYQDPLVSRYTDGEMQRLFSDDFKFSTWRQCWIALAESQKELGIPHITDEMIEELVAAQHTVDYEVAQAKEKETRHDVMSHVYEYGTHCPKAKGIIHLGATSQFVCCNTELIQLRKGLTIIIPQLVQVMRNLSKLAKQHASLVTLAYTHYQPAQPTTLGKRFTLYLYDLLLDLQQLEHVQKLIQARGAKGTTGTQASYLSLFQGDHEKVRQLDEKVSQKLGFASSFSVTGQTYSRKIDSMIAKALSGIGESAHKFASDIRLLSNLRVVSEPFASGQTGSSAMVYKKNPMRCERMTALCRKLMHLPLDFMHTHGAQWLERSLDDSAIRRVSIPQLFLLSNAILKLYENVTKGLVLHEAINAQLLNAELPFMATEQILIEACKQGADRQDMHERLKQHALAAAQLVKEGKQADLFARIAADPHIPVTEVYLQTLLQHPELFAGAATQQTLHFVTQIETALQGYPEKDTSEDLNV